MWTGKGEPRLRFIQGSNSRESGAYSDGGSGVILVLVISMVLADAVVRWW